MKSIFFCLCSMFFGIAYAAEPSRPSMAVAEQYRKFITNNAHGAQADTLTKEETALVEIGREGVQAVSGLTQLFKHGRLSRKHVLYARDLSVVARNCCSISTDMLQYILGNLYRHQETNIIFVRDERGIRPIVQFELLNALATVSLTNCSGNTFVRFLKEQLQLLGDKEFDGMDQSFSISSIIAVKSVDSDELAGSASA